MLLSRFLHGIVELMRYCGLGFIVVAVDSGEFWLKKSDPSARKRRCASRREKTSARIQIINAQSRETLNGRNRKLC